MTDLELRNENGTIVAYDRETDEKIPVDVESISTEEQSIKQKVLRVYGPSGDFLRDVPISDYGDIGEAANAARDLLTISTKHSPGTIEFPRTDGAVDYSTTIDYHEGTRYVGKGGEGNATHLNYTGTGRAIDDTKQASITEGVEFSNMRVDAPDGIVFGGFQVLRVLFDDFISIGGGNADTKCFEFTNENARSHFVVFNQCKLRDYEVIFDFIGDSEPIAADLIGIENTNAQTTVDGGVVMRGDVAFTCWHNTLVSDGDKALEVNYGGHGLFSTWIENTKSVGIDLSGLGSNEEPVAMVSGALNPGQSDSGKFDDPEQKLSLIAVDGPDDRRVRPEHRYASLTLEDSGGNGSSKPIVFNSSTDDNYELSNSNGNLKVRNTTDGENSMRVLGSGPVEFGSGIIPNGGGPNDNGQVKFDNTQIYEDDNGEVVVEDSDGNTTTIC